MSVISAGTLSELFEAFPKAIIKVDGDRNIAVEFKVNTNGEIAFDLMKKTAEPETQSGQNQSV